MGRIDKAMRRAAEAALEDEPKIQPSDPGAPVEFPPEEDAVAPRLAEAEAEAEPAHEPEPEPERTPDVPPTDPQATDLPLAVEEGPDRRVGSRHGTLFETVREDLAQKIVIDDRIMPASREQYRKLAGALHHAQGANGLSVVMIASAVAGEGKTLTACNLALTLSESYHKSVLLIDADLRKPMLHQLFRIDVTGGLAEGLTSTEERRLQLHDVSPRLTILPAGRSRTDPMAALASNRMRRVLDEARHAFDWVIIDTPPVGLMTDASLLASMVDGALIVIKAESTSYDLVQRAAESIGEDRVLGVVLNRSMVLSQSHYGYGYDAYGEYFKGTTGSADERS